MYFLANVNKPDALRTVLARGVDPSIADKNVHFYFCTNNMYTSISCICIKRDMNSSLLERGGKCETLIEITSKVAECFICSFLFHTLVDNFYATHLLLSSTVVSFFLLCLFILIYLYKGRYPLHIASAKGDEDSLDILVEFGADGTVVNNVSKQKFLYTRRIIYLILTDYYDL